MVHFSNLDVARAETDYARSVGQPPGSGAGGSYARFVKRGFDIVVVLLAAPFVVPVVLLLGLLIARDGGPVFYFQDRVGRGGRVFRIWKLRSMVVDAERRLEEHLTGDPTARAEWSTTQKLKNDPRITPVGRLIRKASLDELPQLWNVLKGDMSLVGPRPMLPGQTSALSGAGLLRAPARPDRLLADLAPQRDLLRRPRRLRHRLRRPDVAADRPPGAARHRPGGAARHRLLRPRRAGRRLQVYAIAASGPGREALCSRAPRGPRARPRPPLATRVPDARPFPAPPAELSPGSVRRRRQGAASVPAPPGRACCWPPCWRWPPATPRPSGPRRTTSGRWRCSPTATTARARARVPQRLPARRRPCRGAARLSPGCCATAARPARR